MRSSYIFVLILCFLFVKPFTGFTQEQPIRFERFTTGNGLSNNTISGIYKDKRDFLWLVTRKGINRFDGTNFKTYNQGKNNAGLLYSVTTFCETKSGKFYMGGTQTGLLLYSYNELDIKQLNSSSNKELYSNTITFIFEDSESKLWIGTDKGLNLYLPDENKFIAVKISAKKEISVSKIIEDSRKNIWVLASNTLYLLNKNNFSLQKSAEVNFNAYLLMEAEPDNIWIGGEGFACFNPKTNIVNNTIYKGEWQNWPLLDFIKTNTNEIWIGTDGGGLFVFSPESGLVKHIEANETDVWGLSRNSVYKIYQDNKNIIWIGTVRGGLNKWAPEKWKFEHFYHKSNNENSLGFNDVISFCEDSEQNIWIGTDGGGLDCFNPKTGIFTHFKTSKEDLFSISDNVVTSVVEDSLKNLWITTYNNGLNLYRPNERKFYRFNSSAKGKYFFPFNSLISLCVQKNILWIGTHGNGLVKMSLNDYSFSVYGKAGQDSGITAENVQTIVTDKKGNLWVGTTDGLNLLPAGTDKFVHFFRTDNIKSLSNNTITCILADTKETVWIGTINGLNKYNSTDNTFTRFTVENGLPDNTIMGIKEDNKGNLWLSTNNGIACIFGKNGVLRTYDVNDGVQDKQFLLGALKSSTGHIYFGGVNGFNRFTPEKITTVSDFPNLVLTNFILYNKVILPGDEINGRVILTNDISETSSITLNYSESFFTIEFIAVDYISPSKIKYAYKLEPINKDWNYADASRNFANYTNLAPGEYTFRLKSTNSDLIWNNREVVLKITINPPVWMTWWFRTISVVLVVILLVSFYLIRINQVKKQKRKLEIKVTERTRELSVANQSLTERKEEIQQQAEELLTINEALETEKNNLEKAYNNSRLVTEFGQKLAMVLNPENLNKIVFEYIQSLTDVIDLGIGIFDVKQNSIVFEEFMCNGKNMHRFIHSLNTAKSAAAWVINKRKPLLFDCVGNTDFAPIAPPECHKGKTGTEIVFPLIVEERIIGIFLVSSNNADAFTGNNYNLLSQLASYIAIAFDNANAYEIVHRQNDLIKSSIHYAQTIQNAILPGVELYETFNEVFVIYKPKDIVSGDFYWFNYIADKDISLLAVVDCTGHGVPGAFMSLIGSQLLNRIVLEKNIYEPYLILETLEKELIHLLKQNDTNNHEGMDIVLCCIEYSGGLAVKCKFSGAKNSLCHYNKNTNHIEKYKTARHSIGGVSRLHKKDYFANSEIQLNPGDILYLFTDGIIDLNNEERIRFGSKRFESLLYTVCNKSLEEQKQCIENEIKLYCPDMQHRDDITIIALKI